MPALTPGDLCWPITCPFPSPIRITSCGPVGIQPPVTIGCYSATRPWSVLAPPCKSAIGRRAGCPDAKVNHLLLEHLPRKFHPGPLDRTDSPDHAAPASRDSPCFSRPRWLPSISKPGKKGGLTKDALLFDTLLSIARNVKAHPEETWAEETYTERFQEHRTLLDQLLSALGFLEDYTLYVPYRGPRPDLLHEAYVLRGPATPPEFVNDLNISLDDSVTRSLEYETTPLLVSRKEPARQLTPLPTFGVRST